MSSDGYEFDNSAVGKKSQEVYEKLVSFISITNLLESEKIFVHQIFYNVKCSNNVLLILQA